MDKILKMFFEPQRWNEALNKGSVKGIDRPVLKELMSPQGRIALLEKIMCGQYHIERPHTAKIPKDTPGEFRTVFVNSGIDRVFLSLVNDLLFDIAGDMVHKQCTSYQKGIGCAKVVTKASALIDKLSGDTHQTIGFKADFTKYFDTVPIQFIDKAFDAVEKQHGKSVILDIVREYYHNDKYYDSEIKQECDKFQSLKQGCAVASWLANVVLYHLDEQLSSLGGFYVRYSDDTLYIGKDYEKAMQIMQDVLGEMGMALNPKKVEYLNNDKWFKFLGFSIKGKHISLSPNRIKTFVTEVRKRTIRKTKEKVSYQQALRNTQSWLYYGDGQYSWATGVLKTINVEKDIQTLNAFVMDCLRAVRLGKQIKINDIGGLGWNKQQEDGCIVRGKGKRVATLKKQPQLEGYHTLKCMRNNLLFGRDLYDSVVRDLL